MKSHEMDLEMICHPKMVTDYPSYKDHTYRIYGWGYPMVKIYRHLESSVYKMKRGYIKEALQDLKKDVHKVMEMLFG